MEVEVRDQLELVGSQDAARALRIEIARLVSAAPDIERTKPAALGPHRVAVPFDEPLAALLLTYARTPSRLFWDWARVGAARLEALDRGLRQARPLPPLEGFRSFTVDVRSKGRMEASPLQVRGVVRRVAETAWGWTLDPGAPEVHIAVRGQSDGVWIGADLGGDLTARGYRPPRQAAPLRENLAAQMVALSGWFPDREPLIDPFAGSGTILAEAYGWARGLPARDRRPTWLSAGGSEALFDSVEPRLFGLEDDPRQRPVLNAVLPEGRVDVAMDDFRHVDPGEVAAWAGPSPGLILTNPPYGVRVELEPEALEALYRDLADWWRGLGAHWRIGLIGFSDPIERVFGPRPRMKKPMRNGDLRTHFFLYAGAGSG